MRWDSRRNSWRSARVYPSFTSATSSSERKRRDWILRAETPGTYAVANEKIGDLLEDCTSTEMQDFLRILEDVKRAVRRKK